MRRPNQRDAEANWQRLRTMRQSLRDVLTEGGPPNLTLLPIPTARRRRRRYELTAGEKRRLRALQGHRCGRVGCQRPLVLLTSHNSDVTHTAAKYSSLEWDFLCDVPTHMRWLYIRLLFGGAVMHPDCHRTETRIEYHVQCNTDAAEIVAACGLTPGSELHNVLAFPSFVQQRLATLWRADAGPKYQWVDERLVWRCRRRRCPSRGADQNERANVFSFRLTRTNDVPTVAATLVPPICGACRRGRGRRCEARLAAVTAAGDLAVAVKYGRSGDFSTQTVASLVRRQMRREARLREQR